MGTTKGKEDAASHTKPHLHAKFQLIPTPFCFFRSHTHTHPNIPPNTKFSINQKLNISTTRHASHKIQKPLYSPNCRLHLHPISASLDSNSQCHKNPKFNQKYKLDPPKVNPLWQSLCTLWVSKLLRICSIITPRPLWTSLATVIWEWIRPTSVAPLHSGLCSALYWLEQLGSSLECHVPNVRGQEGKWGMPCDWQVQKTLLAKWEREGWRIEWVALTRTCHLSLSNRIVTISLID